MQEIYKVSKNVTRSFKKILPVPLWQELWKVYRQNLFGKSGKMQNSLTNFFQPLYFFLSRMEMV
jgi:hypothetical protein